MDKNRVLQLIDDYISDLKLSEIPDAQERIRNLYISELEHAIEMNDKCKLLTDIAKYNFLGLAKTLNRFEYLNRVQYLETDEDYFTFVVIEVNDIFSKLFKGAE